MMSSEKKFGLLRNLLRAFGLSQEAVDDVVTWISDLVAGNDKDGSGKKRSPEFPYHQRNSFLSPAEIDFFKVLREAVNTRAYIHAQISLGALFYVNGENGRSHLTTYTNKIDRKRIDFLLCHPTTMRPLLGIELDDSSHKSADRQERDALVDGTFAAAGLPLLHVKVKRNYAVNELASQLAPYLGNGVESPAPTITPTIKQENEMPACPKCGSQMALRTAKSGTNAGNQFWGCTNYPTCRTVLPYTN